VITWLIRLIQLHFSQKCSICTFLANIITGQSDSYMYYVLSTSLFSLTLFSTTNRLRLVATCSTQTIVSSRISCAGLQKSYLPMQIVEILFHAQLILLARTIKIRASKAPIVENFHFGAAPHKGCELRVIVHRFVGPAYSTKSIANMHIVVDY